jgi:tRNA threonylcarbamoyladenosine biosynthesis protein TsaB
MCEELLRECQINTGDLKALSLSVGPGSYTGLRIGASLAKAICYAHSIPLIELSTLKAWANAIVSSDITSTAYAGAIDARRSAYYIGIYNKQLRVLQEDQFQELGSDFMGILEEYDSLSIAGSACDKLKKHLPNLKIRFLPDLKLEAFHLVKPAWELYKKAEFSDLAYFEPNYIKTVHITK